MAALCCWPWFERMRAAQTIFPISMHIKIRNLVAGLYNWQSLGAIALIVGGTFSVSPTSLAEGSFPPPMASRPAVRFSGASPAPLGQSPAPQDDLPAPLDAVSASWEGMSSDFQWEPPDPHGAAGPSGIIQTVNLRIKY